MSETSTTRWMMPRNHLQKGKKRNNKRDPQQKSHWVFNFCSRRLRWIERPAETCLVESSVTVCAPLQRWTRLDDAGLVFCRFFFRFCGPSKFFNSSRGSRFLDPDHSELLRSRSMVATSQDKKKTRIYWRRWLCRRVNWMVAGRGVCKIAVTPWRKLRCRGLALHSTHLVLSCWCRQSKIDLCAITRWDGTRPKWVDLPLLHNRNCIRDRSTSNLRQGLNSMVSKYLTCNDYFRQQWKNAILS